METKKNEKTITREQADKAADTLKAYYKQKRAEGDMSGGEDVSSMFLVMQAGTHHISICEGVAGNLVAELVGVMCANPDLVKVFGRALDLMNDNSPQALALKGMAKNLFGCKVLN